MRTSTVMPEQLGGLSLFHPTGHLVQPTNPFGKDIANVALFRSLILYGGFSEIAVLNQVGMSDMQLEAEMSEFINVDLLSTNIAHTALPA